MTKSHIKLSLTNLLLLTTFVKYAQSSIGDRQPQFQHLLQQCIRMNCSASNEHEYLDNGEVYDSWIVYTLWSCVDNCKYVCMWIIVDMYKNAQRPVPQFYGKWPIVRLFGVQEPFSTLFSMFNLVVLVKLFWNYWKIIQSEKHRLSKAWLTFFAININAWLWSIAFHIRDIPFTEFMDYAGAFSILAVNFYVMSLRFIPSGIWRSIWTSALVALVSRYIYFLKYEPINYSVNMQLNVALGVSTAAGWLFYFHRNTVSWKCYAYVILMGCATLLELLDFEPIFYALDAHALWHLATSPLHFLFFDLIKKDASPMLSKDRRVLIKDKK